MSHPFHVKLEAAGHKLIRNEDGEVDVFRLDAGFHNGPECELCGKVWCHHCETIAPTCPKAATDKPSQPDL